MASRTTSPARLRNVPPSTRDAVLAILTEDPSVSAVAVFDRSARLRFANDAWRDAYRLPKALFPDTAVDDHGPSMDEILPAVWTDIGPAFGQILAGEALRRERGPIGGRHWQEHWRPVRATTGQVLAVLVTVDHLPDVQPEMADHRLLAERRGELLELAAHELRSPLASIIGYAMLALRKDGLSPQLSESLAAILEQAHEMTFRLNMFLDASEAEDLPDAPVTEDEVNLRALLEDEGDALLARQPNVSLAVTCGAPLSVPTDAKYVRPILANLLDNAVRYGGGSITLSAETDDTYAVIRVEDNGPGIAPEDQRRIFDRGFRSTSGRGRSSVGRGLGLYVAREFALRLGGSLSVRSQVGRGTTFILRLPMREEARSSELDFFPTNIDSLWTVGRAAG